MLEINRVFNLLRRTLMTVLLAGLILVISLPATSVQAFAATTSPTKGQINTEENRISGFDEIESGKRAAEVMPKELGSGSRQKNPGEMLKRAGEELGNDQVQRAFGAEDYDRSGLEAELARNKAKRGE